MNKTFFAICAILLPLTVFAKYICKHDHNHSFAKKGFASRYLGLSEDIDKFKNGNINLYYNDKNSIMNDDTYLTESFKNAAKEWEKVCNLTFTYQGDVQNSSHLKNSILLKWSEEDPENAGAYSSIIETNYAEGTQYGLYYTEQSEIVVFTQKEQSTYINSKSLMMHEIGHSIGLGHSDNPISIMYANPYDYMGDSEVFALDDMQACQDLYGMPKNKQPYEHYKATRKKEWNQPPNVNITFDHRGLDLILHIDADDKEGDTIYIKIVSALINAEFQVPKGYSQKRFFYEGEGKHELYVTIDDKQGRYDNDLADTGDSSFSGTGYRKIYFKTFDTSQTTFNDSLDKIAAAYQALKPTVNIKSILEHEPLVVYRNDSSSFDNLKWNISYLDKSQNKIFYETSPEEDPTFTFSFGGNFQVDFLVDEDIVLSSILEVIDSGQAPHHLVKSISLPFESEQIFWVDSNALYFNHSKNRGSIFKADLATKEKSNYLSGDEPIIDALAHNGYLYLANYSDIGIYSLEPFPTKIDTYTSEFLQDSTITQMLINKTTLYVATTSGLLSYSISDTGALAEQKTLLQGESIDTLAYYKKTLFLGTSKGLKSFKIGQSNSGVTKITKRDNPILALEVYNATLYVQEKSLLFYDISSPNSIMPLGYSLFNSKPFIADNHYLYFYQSSNNQTNLHATSHKENDLFLYQDYSPYGIFYKIDNKLFYEDLIKKTFYELAFMKKTTKPNYSLDSKIYGYMLYTGESNNIDSVNWIYGDYDGWVYVSKANKPYGYSSINKSWQPLDIKTK